MPMLEKYRHYFNIDPDYFPAVNEAVITKNPEVWEKILPPRDLRETSEEHRSASWSASRSSVYGWKVPTEPVNPMPFTRSKSCWIPAKKKPVNTSRDIKWTTTCTTASRP